jgi:integrase
LRLLRHTGLRIGEMLALDLTAFDPSAPHGPTLRVALGKTRCQRLLPLSPDTVAILQAILQQRAQAHAPCPLPPALADALMRDACGRKLSAHACRALLKTLAVQLHTTESLYPHRLRHTFATELARAGLSVPVLMKLLGHRSPTMTLRYVDVAATDIRQHYQRALQQLKTFQHLPDCPSHPAAPDSLPAILHLLLGALEARRRDATDPRLNLALQRLAKRVRKVRDDFHNLLEKPPPPV